MTILPEVADRLTMLKAEYEVAEAKLLQMRDSANAKYDKECKAAQVGYLNECKEAQAEYHKECRVAQAKYLKECKAAEAKFDANNQIETEDETLTNFEINIIREALGKCWHKTSNKSTHCLKCGLNIVEEDTLNDHTTGSS